MSVTSGFFNSLNGDRRYNAEQMSAIFDGIINDGIFANIGTAFGVKADVGNAIAVGIGRAWFNSTWVLNDAVLPITVDASEVLLDRYDAVVIEIDHSEAVRAGSIKIVKGTPSSSPQRPTMESTPDVHQYPLAYIYRKAGSNEIVQADITNMIGTENCPYITGILQVINIDNVVAQWQDQWTQWYNNEVENSSNQIELLINWMNRKQDDFDSWFMEVQDILKSTDNGEILEEVRDLLADIYRVATEADIDRIIGGTYIEEAEQGSIFEAATNEDIDDIIGGTYVEGEEPEDASKEEITIIVNNAFKGE